MNAIVTQLLDLSQLNWWIVNNSSLVKLCGIVVEIPRTIATDSTEKKWNMSVTTAPNLKHTETKYISSQATQINHYGICIELG